MIAWLVLSLTRLLTALLLKRWVLLDQALVLVLIHSRLLLLKLQLINHYRSSSNFLSESSSEFSSFFSNSRFFDFFTSFLDATTLYRSNFFLRATPPPFSIFSSASQYFINELVTTEHPSCSSSSRTHNETPLIFFSHIQTSCGSWVTNKTCISIPCEYNLVLTNQSMASINSSV